ncbi:MAG: phosphatidylserine decarboxylase [Victivallaceae bacterium]|nr:phosphatidylserine decarboxylase [Victivallaceae bacterium]MDD4181730.1 phosphatidylserine decarboxylase [Victivallaceae bacterium]
MTLTRYGFKEWFGSALIALAVVAIAMFISRWPQVLWLSWTLGTIAIIFWIALAAFFRNPHRTIPADPDVLVSPADGVVKDIEVLDECDIEAFAGQKVVRIGIFLSVLNVHLNRAPCALNVTSKHYREGEYLDARSEECAKRNEAMTIVGTGTVNEQTFKLAVRQISGAIARRIVCPVEPGRQLAKGEIYGMIKFGSRTEIYFPEDANLKICVNIGEAVTAGTTIFCRVES